MQLLGRVFFFIACHAIIILSRLISLRLLIFTRLLLVSDLLFRISYVLGEVVSGRTIFFPEDFQ